MNNVFEYFKFILPLRNYLQRLQRHVWYLTSLILLLFCFQPAFARPTTPTRDFVDNGDGTVTHQTTGLKWMRCAIGQTWTGSRCLGVPTTYTYGAAATLTYTFAGQSDWRLPYIEELHTIVERTLRLRLTIQYSIIRLMICFGRNRLTLAVPITLGLPIYTLVVLIA